MSNMARRPAGEEYCPTPEEISEVCEAIRAGWTCEEEIARRAAGDKPVEYCLTAFGWNGVDFNGSNLPPVEAPVAAETCYRLNKMIYRSGLVEKIDIRRT